MKNLANAFLFITLCVAQAANAALYDRGNGMIYDSTQNITWLQDANYAKTSGQDVDGYMDWQSAGIWAFRLSYAGYSDWRLPSSNFIYYNSPFTYDGSTDVGYNNTRSELGHLYYVDLHNIALCNTDGVCGQSGYGFNNASFIDAATQKTVSFLNTDGAIYWFEENTFLPIYFSANVGAQDNGNFAYGVGWAVRDGDVIPAVPVPSAIYFMASSLSALFLCRKRSMFRKKDSFCSLIGV